MPSEIDEQSPSLVNAQSSSLEVESASRSIQVAEPALRPGAPENLRDLEHDRHRRLLAPPQGASALLPLAPYAIFLFVAYTVFATTVDDPFITFRYAANVLAGHGPVFNIGERVEGFSSPLHLLVCIALFKIAPSVGMLFKAKLVSLGFGLVALAQTKALGRQMGLSVKQTLLAQTLVALNVNFALAAVNGLETTLYACLLLAGAQRFVTEQRLRRGYSSALILFVALLARPETLVVFAGLLGLRAWRSWKAGQGIGAVAVWALAFALPACLFIGARIAYYGYPLPNTYYAKQAPLMDALPGGVMSLFQNLSPNRFCWWQPRLASQALIAPIYWGLFFLGLARARRTPAGQAAIVCVLATVAFILRSGGDWMPGCRFIVAVLPFIGALQATAILRNDGSALLASARPKGQRLRVCAALAAWVFAWAVCPHRAWSSAHFSTQDETLIQHGFYLGGVWTAAARAMQELPKGATVAYTEMGYGPYKNLDKTFIDLRGLTDSRIAHLPTRSKTMNGVVFEDLLAPNSPLLAYLQQRPPCAIALCKEKDSAKKVDPPGYRLTKVVSEDKTADGRGGIVNFYVPCRPLAAVALK